MAELTQQQATDIQALMSNVEAAYRQVNAMRTSLSVLINAGVATCVDIQKYNLQAKAVYAYQASVAGIIRAQGGSAPNVPAPVYVVYKGIPGDQAANIDCASAQLRGWTTTPLGDYYVNPAQVTWRQEALSTDNQTVAQLVAAAGQNALAPAGSTTALQGPGQLGIAPLVVVAIVIVGIVIAVVAHIVLKIVEALTDVPGKRETTRQIAVQAEQHRQTLDQRAACYTDCTARGKDPVECAKACSRLTPEFSPKVATGGMGLFGTVLGVALLAGVGYVGWRVYKGRHRLASGSSKQTLPGRRDDVIDAEYTERPA